MLEADDYLLRRLRAFSAIRLARGDSKLVLQPNSVSYEQLEPPEEHRGSTEQGLVLEPDEGTPFEVKDLAKRKQRARISSFCDGIRSTYFVAYEDIYPILYTRNAASVRTREPATGYHECMHNFQRHQSMLLAPFGLFPVATQKAYEQLKLCPNRLADLCWTGLESDEYEPTPLEMQNMGSLAWQGRALRRARHLLDLTEQVVTLAAVQVLREQDPTGGTWLLKDGSLFQFKKEYLRRPDRLRNIVACVKTHPVPFFGIEGERKIRQIEIGQRSVAFLPRPRREVQQGYTSKQTTRPMVSWYMRVRPSDPKNPNHLNGVVRLDIAANDDWQDWIDEVSWAVLDEYYGISAMPDPRFDVMPYGIYDCEQFLKAQQISGELLLAQLG